MIVAERKPLDEIIGFITDCKKILIVGCNECVTVCYAGGKKEVAILASALKMAFLKEGKELEVKEVTLERQCDQEYLEEIRDIIDQYDALVSMACGVGVQFMAEKYQSMPVYPALNTLFMGGAEEMGVWSERCQGCGQCILGQTAGICPITRCAKRLLNGPCGGSTQGHCEINKDLPCAWQLIIDRLKALGRLDDYDKLLSIKDWSTERSGGPRKIVREDLQQ
ncbi:MAG: methylenetetrahydrofolate reductase C-terminal domain-containing protein [Deltaproteobacteria bacterium]|nr:methylenetetrahydrofolate reductase C-terminal domain-containing protein [Deltaproteobacteria bacterium]